MEQNVAYGFQSLSLQIAIVAMLLLVQSSIFWWIKCCGFLHWRNKGCRVLGGSKTLYEFTLILAGVGHFTYHCVMN